MKTLYKKLAKGILTVIICGSFHSQIQAQAGAALNFTGGEYIQVPSLSFGTNWTAEAWINPTNLFGNWNTVLGQCYYNNNQGFVIAVQNGSVFVDSPQGGYITTAITAGVWTHVAVTYNNGIFAFYKNGILVGNKAAPFTNSTNPFYIGIRTNNSNSGLLDPYTGNIDEMRVWNVTRSQCDIQSYMNCEIPATMPGLVANYHFNEGVASGINYLTATTLVDAAGSNTGSLVSFNLGFLFGGSTSNWIAPGGVTSGSVTTNIPLGEVNVKGNSVSIIDGDVTSSITDFTNFNGASTRTFVIESTGSQTLNAGVPYFTGTNATEFSITVNPSSILSALTGTTSFVVAFTPTSLGAKTATLNLYNNDCSEPFYDFVITATAVPAAALNFDGVDDYLETGANLAELGQGDFTIEAWIKTTGVSEGIVTCANGNASWEIGEKSLYLDAGGIPTFVGFGNNYIPGNLAVNDGNWHHIAVTWDWTGGTSGLGNMYVDGVNHTGSVTYVSNNNNIGTFKIGKQNYNSSIPEAPNNFNGNIDEVRIFNRTLCLPEILNNMNCEIPSPTTYPNLNGYYRFDQGIAFGDNAALTSYTNLAVFANVGTLTNFSNIGATSNWISPGGVTTGSSCAVYLFPEINLRGNSVNIINNDATPSLTDFTDFGAVGLASQLSRTFVIQSTGTGSIAISGFSLSGVNASSFTITTNPSAAVLSGASTTIVVTFSAAVLGVKNASVVILSDDCDEPVTAFAITATCAPAAAALNFDGTGDAINTTDPVIGLGNFTIEGWIKPNALTGGFLVSSRYNEGFQTGFWYTIGYGSGFVGMEMAECGNGPSNYTGITSTNSITPGTWGHFAIVRLGSVYSMYINGNLSATLTEVATHNFDNVGVNPSHILNIGGWIQNACCWFGGSMDELRIWKVARTQCEIQSFMNCEIPTTAANLASNYHFNQGADGLGNPTITRLTDASASAYSGTLNASFALTGASSNWIAPGGVTSGNTASVVALIEIDVLGNSTSIPDGNATASTANFTDFNGLATRTFVIQNTVSGGTLVIGTPTIVGTNANQFSITTLPTISISGIGSTTFVVSFIPNSPGVKNATINIASNDCNESLYDFVITATAVAGAGLNFDGVDDIATVSSGINLNSQSFTIEFWAKRTGTGPNILVGQGSSFTNNSALHIGFRPAPGNEFTFAFYGNDINYTTTASTDGIYHHWACVYDAAATGQNRFVYLDGVLVISDQSPSPLLATGPFIIGDVGYGGNPYQGFADELRVWNGVRTQCQIQTYMNCEIAGSQPSLTANYHFNQGVAAGTNTLITSLIDDNTTPKNATLSGFALTGSTSNFNIPGAVTSGSTTPNPPAVILAIEGNGNSIAAGSSTPLLTNFTDFGAATTRTLVMRNIGTGPLYINNGVFSGTNASNFSVTTLPSSVIATSGSSSFVITFTPTAVGSQSAMLTVYSSDCANPQYSFVITASTSPASALSFDGVDDFITIPHNANQVPATDLTIESWVNVRTGSPITNMIVMKGNYGYGFALGSTGCAAGTNLNYWNSPSCNTAIVSTVSIPYNVWTHVAVVVRTSPTPKLEFFINGVSAGTATTGITINNGSNGPLIIGEQGTGCSGCNFFNGSMDELRIWNVSRTQCELQTYMNAEITSTASGLVANYHFNQGIPSGSNTSVTSLLDGTGINNGTLTSFGTLTGSVSNWVSPSQIANGSTTVSPPTSTISLSGLGNTISFGAASSALTGTDFGTLTARSFQINNTGTGTLNISTPYFTGPNAAQFSLTSSPLASITTGTTGFSILFTPTVLGISSATVNIPSNDCTNPTFSFVITASTSPASALDFDGTDNVSVPYNSSFSLTSAFSVELWVKLNTIAGNQELLAKGTDDAVNGHFGFLFTNGYPKFTIFQGGFNNAFTTTNPLSPGVWTHVAGTWNGTLMSLYINGLLVATQPLTGPISLNTGDLQIGWLGKLPSFPYPTNGKFDEVRIWNSARTQCEIQTYMNCEIPGTIPNLVANYHFNQGIPSGSNPTITTLTDAANGNNGTLTSFALNGTSSNWISPGGVISGSITPAPPTASILVSGNSTSITPGSTSTSTLNFTDFGNLTTRTFVIQNSNTGTLNISAPYFTGVNASEFSVTVLPSLSLAASATTSFVVVFTPTTGGFRTATLNINNNDCNIPIFSCALGGTPTPAAALNFDGVSDYITTATSPALAMTTQATIEGWFKTSVTGNQKHLFRIENGSNQGFEAAISSTGYFVFSAYLGGWNPYFGSTGPLLDDGLWHHFAIVASGNSATAYVDGLFEAKVTGTAPLNTGSAFLSIGRHPTAGLYFPGNLDEIRVWNVARSQCDIQSYMKCEIPTTAPGLVANYHFNQGAAGLSNSTQSVLIDATGTINGTLNTFNLTGATSNWVNPGGVISGSITPAIPTASILVSGNSNSITPGSISTSTLNYTDFGTVSTRTFVIKNNATGTLNIAAPYFTGVNASEFSVTVLPTLSLASSATTSFVVVFTPTTGGFRTATLNINNNDCNIPIFYCTVGGTPALASALNFDGVNDNILTSIDADTDVMPNTTWEAWVYPTSTSATYKMVVDIDDTGYDRYLTLNGNQIRISTANPTEVTVTTFAANQWYHLAVVYKQATNDARVYVNGISYGPYTTNFATGTTTNNIKIGANLGGANFFAGLIDEVRIWNTARSQCEIQTYMNCEIPTTATGLIANYHFNQGAAGLDNTTITNLLDASGSNTGTLTGFSLLTGTVSNWVSPGPFANGYSTTTAPSGTITITGNGNNIPVGIATSTNNFTDFGTSTTRTFVITNPGSGTLFINSVSLSGANAPSFSVVTVPGTSLTSLGTTSFVVVFTPTVLGTQSAIITINSSDCTSPNYSFAITATAVPGAALNFDGVDDGATKPLFSAINNSVTLQAKVFMTANQTSNKIIAYNGISSSNGYGLYLFANSPVINIIYGGVAFLPTGYSLTLNQWNSLSMVIENTTVKFYANGVLAYTNLTVTPVVPTGSFMIGVNNLGTENFNGGIDEVLMWSRPLTQCEILTNLTCEIATSSPSLIANYHFNQGIGAGVNSTITTLTDASGNNNHLTLANFAKTGTSSNFISTGAVSSGSSCGVFIASEIDVLSGSISIPDGYATPTTTNNTNFGAVCANTIIVKTFTIQNTGNGPLAISNMSMSGLNATSFSIGVLTPASPIPSNTFAVFSITFAPGVAGIKTATVNISNNDCDEGLYDFVITGTANIIPTVTASISNSVVCAGTSITLTGSGADTYTWSPLVTNAVAFVPTINQIYTLSGTYTLTGCTNTNLATKAVTVNALPVMAITAVNPVICSGIIATLTANGAGTGGTYTWNPNALNGATITPTPSLTTTYSVVGTSSAACISTNVVTQIVTVNTTPTLAATSVNTVICAGFTATLSVNGANTYSWFPGPLTGGTITPSPAATTNYTVTGYGSTGCISSNSIVLTVTVNALPTVTASTSQSLICNTGTTSLIGSGASTYTWTGGIPTITNGVVFTPSTTLSYTVTGTNALTGCTSTNLAVQTISVNPTPTITASAPSSVICNGATATLIVNGASTYTWMPGTIIGATVNPATASLTTYTVVGTSSLGCTSTNVAVQTISVNSLPTVTASISSSVICLGGTVIVTGLGADTYTWNNAVSDGIGFTPTASGIYSVSGTSTLTGCTSTNVTSASLIVNTLPTLTITNTNAVICIGRSVTLSGSGASTYTWSNGVIDNTAFSPTVTSDYTLTATDVNTCTNTAITTITVNNLPVLSVAGSPSISCEAQTTTLTVSGAASYTWNTNENTPNIVIAPTVTTIYTVTAIDVNTCTNTISYTQSVTPCPGTFTATVVKTDISCVGKDDGKIVITPITSYSNPAISYIWNPSNLCPGNNCDTLKHLPSGTYNLTLKITYTVNGTLVKNDSLILAPITLIDLSGPCEVKIFSGITANGDGENDVFKIENIEQFPNNKVEVYNRWGQKVFEMKGYNNLDRAWPLKDELSKLSPNTYFYIIDLGSGSKPIKGWVELMKN